ncbi:MAG: hypothetical protein ACJ797_22325 [Ktedonobacteraceae bacterium]
MENDSRDVIHLETDSQNSGTEAESSHAKPGGKRATSTSNTSRQETDTKGSARAALEEEQRKAAVAQAAVEDLQRRLAAVEASLAEERQKAAPTSSRRWGCSPPGKRSRLPGRPRA